MHPAMHVMCAYVYMFCTSERHLVFSPQGFIYPEYPLLLLHALQAERYLPYYFFGAQAAARPVISRVSSTTIKMGAMLRIDYNGTANAAVISSPSSITHQTNMNQVMVKLIVANQSKPGQMFVLLPPSSGVVAPPGPYLLWLVNKDVPCTQAAWINLTF
jgi:hypothetical protein